MLAIARAVYSAPSRADRSGPNSLVFTVPKTAKGKVLKVKVTIVNGKQSATRITTYKVG
jgi:hypothetical protein